MRGAEEAIHLYDDEEEEEIEVQSWEGREKWVRERLSKSLCISSGRWRKGKKNSCNLRLTETNDWTICSVTLRLLNHSFSIPNRYDRETRLLWYHLLSSDLPHSLYLSFSSLSLPFIFFLSLPPPHHPFLMNAHSLHEVHSQVQLSNYCRIRRQEGSWNSWNSLERSILKLWWVGVK